MKLFDKFSYVEAWKIFLFQNDFFRAYLQETGEEVTKEELNAMYKEANTYALLSHFFWGLWSVLQNDMSNIQFGFMVCIRGYAIFTGQGLFPY